MRKGREKKITYFAPETFEYQLKVYENRNDDEFKLFCRLTDCQRSEREGKTLQVFNFTVIAIVQSFTLHR